MGNPLGLRADPSIVDPFMRLTARQHSVSRRQWLESGLSDRQLQRARESRAIFVIHPGVYAVRGSKASFERDVMAACLATGGVASHRCAAYLWKFRKFERPVVEVLVARGHAPKLPGVVVRRTNRLEGAEDVQRNAEKANELVEWWMLYFTHDDVHGSPAEVAQRIEAPVARRRLLADGAAA